MKKVIFIGKTGAGKTTLCQRLNELNIEYKKTQAVEIYKDSIDTPGEFIENRRLYSAILVTSADADIVAVIYDPKVEENFIPPNLASMFSKEVIGIITKLSLATQKELERARMVLKNALVGKIFEVDAVENIGILELKDYLEG